MRWTFLAVAISLTPALAQDKAGPTDLKSTPPLDAAVHMCGSGDTTAPRTATILTGYGTGGFPIRTRDPQAQAFFDNGMQLAHAFAHKAAIQAFREASRRDPDCAMCLWGEAWAAGATINYPTPPEDVARLAALADRADALAAHAPPRDRALIAALRLRYRSGSGGGAGDRAFARAMERLAIVYPADDEIAVIAADALMIPLSLSNRIDRSLDRAVALLEGVLRRSPDYTPAIHFYIHATEMAGYPARAEPYADRLATLAPSAAHLVHMPSHTWYHIGRYQDAADANVRAVALGEANARRLGLPQPDGVWDLPYHAHNVQYGVGGALLSGDAKSALLLSEPLVARAGVDKRKNLGVFPEMVAGTGYFAEARYADPHKVLALPEPALPYVRAYWHYARGEAAARLGDVASVRGEAAAIPDHVGPERFEDASEGAARMMRIGRLVLTGRAAMMESKPAEALAAFRTAARLQEGKAFRTFSDPPAFWYPVRRDMAAALLALDKPAEALREADATLAFMPKEPVTLALRAQAEARLGRTAEAAADRHAALTLWHGDRALLPGVTVQLAARRSGLPTPPGTHPPSAGTAPAGRS